MGSRPGNNFGNGERVRQLTVASCLPSLELLVVHLKRKTGQSELSPARKSKAPVPKYAFMAMAKKDKNKKIHLAFSVAIEIISRTTLPEQWPPVLPDHFVHKIL